MRVEPTPVMVRPEELQHHDAVRGVVAAAFGSPVEAALVDAIRESGVYVPAWSLVAVVRDQVVGHVMVSVALVREDDVERSVANLSPLAVHPDHQRRGIGSALVRGVVPIVDAAGAPLIVLEGDPAFYSRFGFEHSVPLGITMRLPEWASPEAAEVLRLGADRAGSCAVRWCTRRHSTRSRTRGKKTVGIAR